MSLLDRLNLEGLTPAMLWSALDPETRRSAAQTLYGSASADDSGRLEADAAIAGALRFRPVAVRKLSLEKRVGYLLRSVRPDDSLATTLLLALHLGSRKAMLEAFLDELGIAHEAGAIKADEFELPDAERTAAAVESLYERFPGEEVDVYLAALVAMDPETWSGLTGVLERRR
jgi:hypothetical protein